MTIQDAGSIFSQSAFDPTVWPPEVEKAWIFGPTRVQSAVEEILPLDKADEARFSFFNGPEVMNILFQVHEMNGLSFNFRTGCWARCMGYGQYELQKFQIAPTRYHYCGKKKLNQFLLVIKAKHRSIQITT